MWFASNEEVDPGLKTPSEQKEPTEEYKEIQLQKNPSMCITPRHMVSQDVTLIREGFLRPEPEINVETDQQPVPNLSSILY